MNRWCKSDKRRASTTPGVMLLILAIFGAIFGCGLEGQQGNLAEIEIGTPRFVEVTEAAGLGNYVHETGGYGYSLMPEIVGPGGGVIDYNNDGWSDILLVVGGTWNHFERRQVQAIRLYENNKDGTFTEVTYTVGLKDQYFYGFGVSVADYDNDGDEDFFVSALYQNYLFRNEGGRFVEAGKQAGIANENVWSTSAVFFDADRDGYVDLFVGSYVDWTFKTDRHCTYEKQKVFCTPQEYTGRASLFYKNNGDGTFTNRSREAGFWTKVDTTKDKTLGVAELDFNKDGWPDLFIGNDTENDMLFENQGDGTFKEVGLASGIAVSQHGYARAGMGVDSGVIDSTGMESIFVGNFSDETLGAYRYLGNGQFLDRVAASRLGYASTRTLTFGLFLFDVDLDADLDLLTANGHVLTHIAEVVQGVSFEQPAQLYLNRGNGVFDEYVSEDDSTLTQAMVARGAFYLDYDKDGDLDVVLVENNGPVHLWRNETPTGNYLRVLLRGTQSNASALGATVIAKAGDLNVQRRVKTGSSFLSSSEKAVTIGLGHQTLVDTLSIAWPNGEKETFYNIEANQELFIEELKGERLDAPGE